MSHLVGVRAAADALGLSPSTVSRYLRTYPELIRGGGPRRPLVYVEELRTHRTSMVSPAFAQRSPDGWASPIRSDSGDVISYAKSKAERESVRADKERLELAEKLGQLVPRAEVEEGAREAGRMLQAELSELAMRIADEIAVMKDPHLISGRLEEEHRQVLTKFAAALTVSAESNDK